jgi:hypothetical protein
LHSPVPFQEVEHVLAPMHMPKRPRALLKGHPCDLDWASFRGGYGLL